MANHLVAQNPVTTLTNPQPGQSPIDANTVRNNDNTIASTYTAHDADATIHVQDSTAVYRTGLGTFVAGRKWLDNDTFRVYYDDGAAWNEISYVTTAGGSTIASGTLVASSPALTMTQTWNNAAVAFTGWLMNITNTASQGSSAGVLGSLLMQIQVGGSNVLVVNRAGSVLLGGTSAATTSLSGSSTAGAGSLTADTNIRAMRAGNSPVVSCVRIDTSYAAPSALGNGEVIGTFGFGGSDSTTTISSAASQGAYMTAQTTEAWSTTKHGAKLSFAVTATGSNNATTVLTLDQDLSATLAGSLAVATGFGCNGKTAQTAYASGGVLGNVVAALIANGILSS